MPLTSFHPVIARWFAETLGEPTAAQRRGWASIRDGRHTLIAAPTGSGKTLAAFLSALDDLLQEGIRAPLSDEVRVVYVSPLKALSADIHKNLSEPRSGIHRLAADMGFTAPRITAAVRTGDTTQGERAAMLRTPPHVLVTTPESLYLLLTAERSREMLRTARTVIVDEIHAVIGGRRGAHLALSLERLQQVAERPLVRIGLSATQKPIEEVARFLVGVKGACAIVDEGHRREMDVDVEIPRSPLEAVMSHEVWEEYYDRLAQLIAAHRTTLVFVNTRRMAERLARHLSERVGENAVAAHHGSLSKEKRLDSEVRLKAGELKALVATASLELGIDIGHVDLACQIGSPHRIATFIQRIGRSGHTVSGVPKGRLFPMSRDDLVECLALLRSYRLGDLDRVVSHDAPLDVLTQQIVAEASCREYGEDELFDLVRAAWPFRDLARRDFDAVVSMAAEGFATRRGRRGALIHRDEVHAHLRGRRGTRLLAITSGGAIPETADYRVLLDPDDTFIGTLNEDFAIESMAGDVFQLGNTSWRILQVGPGTVRVADAKGAPPNIPFWLGEAPARSDELSKAVSDLRADVDGLLFPDRADPIRLKPDATEVVRLKPDATDTPMVRLKPDATDMKIRLKPDATDARVVPLKPDTADTIAVEDPRVASGFSRIIDDSLIAADVSGPADNIAVVSGFSRTVSWLAREAGVSLSAAEQAVAYLAEGRRALGVMPTQDTLVLERFFDESGGMQLVLHAPFGSRINKAWGLALRKRFCRQFNFELQAAATEDALLLSLGPQHSFPLADVFRYLHPATARDVLVQAFLDAPVFQTRWRWNTTIALAVPRNRAGKKVAPQLQRMLADDLMAATFPDAAACLENIPGDRQIPDHPLVNQTVRDCLDEAMDFQGLTAVLGRIHAGALRLVSCDTPQPSPLSHEIVNARPYAFLDDAPLEERRTQAVYARRATDPSSADGVGRLDAAAIDRVRGEARPDPRDTEELHDVLLSAGALTSDQLTIPASSSGSSPNSADEVAPAFAEWFDRLVEARRAVAVIAPFGAWVAAERLPELRAIHPDAMVHGHAVAPASRTQRTWTREDAIVEMLRGQLTIVGPTTARALARVLAIDETESMAALVALESEGSVLRGSFTGTTADIEWCDRRLLARIHRYTLARLRAEIEPVSPSVFMRFLFVWQHVHPSTRLTGIDGLRTILASLDGFEVAASAWERAVLPARLDGYEPSLLDTLCLAGEAGWARFSAPVLATPAGRLIGATPIALFVREHADAWLASQTEDTTDDSVVKPDQALGPTALAVLDAMRRRGASFVRELAVACAAEETTIGVAVGELAAVGLAASDGFAGLRSILTASGERQVLGTSRGSAVGRWSLLRRDGAAISHEAAVEIQARSMLARYGVVFRRLLTREPNAAPWRDLARVYRRLEARGEIRGGRFVAGMSGEQFALPEAVERLREVRRSPADGRLTVISAADPLNLTGIVTAGDRVRAIGPNRVVYRDGVPIAALEGDYMRPLVDSAVEIGGDVATALTGRRIPGVVSGYVGRAG